MDVELDGYSVSRAFKDLGLESLYKRFKGLSPRDGDAGQLNRLRRDFMEQMLPKLQRNPNAGLFERALSGDPEAAAAVMRLSMWETYQLSEVEATDLQMRVVMAHNVEIERASTKAAAALARGEYAQVAAMLAADPVTCLYFSESALGALAASTTNEEVMGCQAVGMLECQLATIARVERAVWPEAQAPEDSPFAGLPDGPCAPKCIPGRAVIRSLMSALGCTTQAQLLELDSRPSPLDDSVLKRWHSGRQFPDANVLGRFARSVCEGLPTARAGELLTMLERQYWCAHRLHRLISMAGIVIERIPGQWEHWTGTPDATAWVAQRYVQWWRHWKASAPVS